MCREGEHAESDVRVWNDSGDDGFADAAAESASGLAEAVVDRRSTEVLGVAEETASGTIWSFLRAPADGVVVLVDGIHSLTGAPW
jgi:hypothetical protein